MFTVNPIYTVDTNNNDKNECLHCKGPFKHKNDYIEPCNCVFGIYHKKCLKKWINNKSNKQEINKCEICKTVYKGVIIDEVRLEDLITIKAKVISIIFAILQFACFIMFCTNNDKKNNGASLFVGLIIFYTIIPIHIIIISIVDCRNYISLLCIHLPGRNIRRNTTLLKITFNDDIV